MATVPRLRWAPAVLLAALLTACGDDSTTPAAGDGGSSSSPPAATAAPVPTGPSTSPTARTTAPGTTVVAAPSEFGRILFDETGQAIYVFDVETTSTPRCYDACAEAWPPVLTDGDPLAGEGVTASLLGTTRRTGGADQVTYGGHPLYFYAHEGKREVECHDIFLNGGTWYAVQPDGNPAP